MKLKCKDCTKYKPTADKNHGVCSLPEDWFPTKADDDCRYVSVEEFKCKNCLRFGYDFACFAVDENESAESCSNFVDIQEKKIYEVLWDWFKRGIYSREKVMEMCDEFEQSEKYKFFQSINKESDTGE